MSFFGYMRKTYFQTSFFVLLFLIEKVLEAPVFGTDRYNGREVKE